LIRRFRTYLRSLVRTPSPLGDTEELTSHKMRAQAEGLFSRMNIPEQFITEKHINSMMLLLFPQKAEIFEQKEYQVYFN